MLKELLGKIVSDLGAGAQAKEGREGASLTLKGAEIFFRELAPGLFFRTAIGETPAERKEEFFSHLMHANLLGQGTGGAVLGMSEDEKFLTLSLIIPYELDYAEFALRVEEFANFADFWRAEVERFKKESRVL